MNEDIPRHDEWTPQGFDIDNTDGGLANEPSTLTVTPDDDEARTWGRWGIHRKYGRWVLTELTTGLASARCDYVRPLRKMAARLDMMIDDHGRGDVFGFAQAYRKSKEHNDAEIARIKEEAQVVLVRMRVVEEHHIPVRVVGDVSREEAQRLAVEAAEEEGRPDYDTRFGHRQIEVIGIAAPEDSDADDDRAAWRELVAGDEWAD